MSDRLYSGTLGLREPWGYGLGALADVWSRWWQLDITHIGSLLAIAGTVPTAARFLTHAWREAYACIRRFFLASVTVPGGDPLNRSIVQWLESQQPRHHRSFTGRTQVGHLSDDRAAALKKAQLPTQYLPHWRTRWFIHNRAVFVITRATGYAARDNDGVGTEELTVGCIGWSPEPVKELIQSCREYAERQAQFFVIIYSRDRYGVGWKPRARTPIRHLDTVHFDAALKQQLLADIKNYLDPQTRKRYASRSMPYRRGYLFHGPPGTGKSSLSVAIAGEFGLDLYEVKVPSVATDADLEQMFQEIPPRCIVLLEDIDAVWTDRAHSDSREDDGKPAPSCTLSGLLNVLDGVGSQEGRIVIMTTNRPDHLDCALVRPGRVDMKVFLGNISQASAKEMFIRMFSPDSGGTTQMEQEELQSLASQFATSIPPNVFTPSLLQSFFQLHLESPQGAVESIGAWVQHELAKKADQDFEVVDEKPNAQHTSS